MILAVDDLPRNRIPVLVDIGRAHEDRDLQPFVLKIFSIRDLFDHDHFSIGRTDDQVGPHRPLADGHPKERDQE